MFLLEEVTLGYGKQQVLSGLNLSIAAGECVALVGASGSGKSTLLQQLYHQQRQHSAYCPQQHGLVEPLSVYHNIYMGQLSSHSALYNLLNLIRPTARHRQAISTLCAELGLTPQLFRSVDQLSGGQQQRTAIGRALYQQQCIFIGDEPLSSLDPIQGTTLLELIKRRHQTVIVVLHDRRLALEAFDRIIGLKKGRIVLDAPSGEVTATDIDGLYT